MNMEIPKNQSNELIPGQDFSDVIRKIENSNNFSSNGNLQQTKYKDIKGFLLEEHERQKKDGKSYIEKVITKAKEEYPNHIKDKILENKNDKERVKQHNLEQDIMEKMRNFKTPD